MNGGIFLAELLRIIVRNARDAREAADMAQPDDPSEEFYLRRPAERQKSRFQRFLAREGAQAVMSTIGALFNSRNSKIYLTDRPASHFDFDGFPHFADLYRHFVRGSARNNRGDLPRLYMLLLNISRVLKDNIPGDLAEIGVYKGNTARILAEAARAGGRRLYLFDTFGGFDAADFNASEPASASFRDTSLAAVKEFVGTSSVEFIVGRFPDSLSGIAMPDRFAIVHLDCDLYKPTAAALDYFYPRLSAGGLLILHDYSSGHWSGCAQAIDEFLKDKPDRPVLMPDKSGTAIVVKS
jgi:O-methyltransferase